MLVVIIVGSPSDESLGARIGSAAEDFGLKWEVRVASAHKTPARLLEMLKEYEQDAQPKVYVTVAGRSNALSGMVDAQVSAPVIACPPYSEKYAGADLLSSLRVPSGVAPAVVLEPNAAALLAAKMLGLAEPKVRQKIEKEQEKHRQRLADADGLSKK